MSHPVFTLIAAGAIAIGLALAENRSPRERINYAVYMFLSCILAVVAGGWVMHIVHG
jgi:4-hydroxybenzoate polyprenyltransferase